MRSTMLEPIGTLSSFASHRLWLVISDHAVGEAPARKANSRQQKDLAMNDQREVEQFLGDGASYGTPGGAVERIDTHISMIFLVGDRAYKLKRAVRFSYLDYSTVELRKNSAEPSLISIAAPPRLSTCGFVPSPAPPTARSASMAPAPSSTGCLRCAALLRTTYSTGSQSSANLHIA